MICTEEEAKSKWCPLFHGGSGSNRWHYGEDCRVHEQTCCLGSACMWWVWVERSRLRPEVANTLPDDDRPVGGCGGTP